MNILKVYLQGITRFIEIEAISCLSGGKNTFLVHDDIFEDAQFASVYSFAKLMGP
jgi:hypothetical protein